MKNIIKELCPYIVVLAVVILLKIYIIAPVQVNGDSMNSTLQSSDIMILNKIGYELNGVKRFDIVVIKNEGKHLIKRIIGLPGEIVKVSDNKLYINGEEIDEPFLDEDTFTNDFELKEKIPEGYYFVMGDNREISLDSRVLGLFSEDDIEGKANFTLFPFTRFGFKD